MRYMTKAAVCAFFLFFFTLLFPANEAAAKQQAQNSEAGVSNSQPAARDSKPSGAASIEERLQAMEKLIERQQQEIKELRTIVEKMSAAGTMASPSEASRVESLRSETSQAKAVAVNQTPASGRSENDTQKKVDELYKHFGQIRLSGDIRFRFEPFRNHGFDSLVEAPSRNRFRIRARLALDGSLNEHFDWGLKLASGIFTDAISSNQTLTDFFERKPFALERAFIRYDSKGDTIGAQLVAGRFEPTFRRTQMVWDDDVNVEGASEAIYFKPKSKLDQLRLVAFQLPFNEVSNGKDGVVYGGQLQSDWKLSPSITANANVAYYGWNHADQVAQALGASPNQVNGGISNGAGTTGNQNGPLGTTNRIIRDEEGRPIGFLANFHLLDLLGNLTFQTRPRLPLTFTLDYVRNVSRRIDDEKNGYWAGVQLGQTVEKGDWLVGYTFTRIEQDAVLVPFNFSDILASNSRTHIPTVAYQMANGVVLQWTGLFSQRANKVVPTSPFNRWSHRMQFDVIYKF